MIKPRRLGALAVMYVEICYVFRGGDCHMEKNKTKHSLWVWRSVCEGFHGEFAQ